VPTDEGFSIIVDYAHTPDALEKLLHSVRELGPSRIITVFGCGGDRDKSKRPKMAKAASENSEITIVTSDNPRTEDPEAILRDVVEGIVGESETIIDRREAIMRAVSLAREGDVVVIAGKGHENYQIIGRTKYPMDDREMAREALACR
jgi:UDP-N-acetylmuramoyl-L-alanyl-D-glutamate--2,6-diaminopimelate ligase